MGSPTGIKQPKNHSPTPAPQMPRECPLRAKAVDEIVARVDAEEFHRAHGGYTFTAEELAMPGSEFLRKQLERFTYDVTRDAYFRKAP